MSLDPGDRQDSGEAKRVADEAARAQAADDQWRASLPGVANQAKVFYDSLIDTGFEGDAAATITGHWLAASISAGPLQRMVERFMSFTEDRDEEE